MEHKEQETGHRSNRLRKIRFRRSRKTAPGAAPGAGISHVDVNAPRPHIRICCFNSDTMDVIVAASAAEVRDARKKFPDRNYWIEVQGFGDRAFIEELTTDFNIHRLEMDDVVNTYQRPKIEETPDHIFIISRPIVVADTNELREDDMSDDQLSLFLGRDFVLTLQEKRVEYTSAVFERMNQNKGLIRKSGPDYLAYAIMDSIVDSYFPLLEKFGNFLDDLEDKLLEAPDVYSLQNIQGAKRRLIFFRRITWSEREKFSELLRIQNILVKDTTKRYIRDTYDHTIQIMDMIDSYREITASLMDIYLSSVSNRMNNIMKVLTIISTIFIPLTFIVGLYGMNFSYSDPVTGDILPYNMPELYSPYGYIGVCITMFVIAVVLVYFFYRRGWIDFRKKL
jgi:magnesium transporter